MTDRADAAAALDGAERIDLGPAKYDFARRLSAIVTVSGTWEEAAERAAALFSAPPTPAPSVEAMASLDVMAERLVAGLRNVYPQFDSDLAMLPWFPGRLVAYTLTGLPPGAERDAALSTILARLGAATTADPGQSVRIGYTNWRGENTTPTILPTRVYWGSNEWHPEPCWLLEALDVAKGALRTFDLRKIRPFATPADPARAALDGAVRDLVALARSDLAQARRHAVHGGNTERWILKADDRLRSALAARGDAGDGWRPIETAPRDGSRIWLYRPECPENERQAVGWWHQDIYSDSAWWMDASDSEQSEPTHWRPLPAPPTGREG